ncbi:MAG: peptide deformylase [Minisyncoccia bacterium]
MVKIVQEKEGKILRLKAKSVPIKEITSKRVKKIISDMKKALDSQDDGVAIAAPQIGVAERIIIISGKVKAIIAGEDESEVNYPDEVFVNPVIIRSSRDKHIMEEGCLSVRWLYGKVKRSTKVEVEGYDENGKKIRRGASGLMSQIFQHEVDHLEGVLFIDKAKDLHEFVPETKGIREDLKRNA